jgi:hypothetical protein
MAELSPEDQEKLRRLEEEIDRDREASRKRREELEKKAALVPVDEDAPRAVEPKKESTAPAPTTDSDAAWKRGMRKKIAIGTGAALAGYVVLANIGLLITCGVVVAGVYYFSGKYLGEEPPKKEEEKKA